MKYQCTSNSFILNKYSIWYFAIIDKASKENRIKSTNRYYELHHIIPRSIGGNNSKKNLVLLTAKEHFICHLLLCKMTQGQQKIKMLYAFGMMQYVSSENQKRYTSKLYEYVKIKVSEAQSISRTGKKRNKEFCEKNRNRMLGNTYNLGKKRSIDSRKKLSNALKGKNTWSKNRVWPEEIKQKIRESNIKAKSSIKGKTMEEIHGAEKAKKIKQKISEKLLLFYT